MSTRLMSNRRPARGVALPVMMIMLTVMLISSIYLLKSSLSSTLLTSRLAYDAQLAKAAHGRELAGNTLRRHRDHFDRQRELAEPGHELAFVGDADELARLGSDNFFARQGRAAALDHVAGVINFIGAVHVNRQLFDLGRIKHRDAQSLQALG